MNRLIFFILVFFTIFGCKTNIKKLSESRLDSKTPLTIYAFVDYGCGYCQLLRSYFEKQNPCEKCIEIVYLKEKDVNSNEFDCPKEILIEKANEFKRVLPYIKIYDNENKKVIKTIKGFWPKKLDEYMTSQCKN